jgi:hypothetical protein
MSCLRSLIPVQIAVQNPSRSVNLNEKLTTIKSLYDIVTELESHQFAKDNLKIRFYDDYASIRLTVLRDKAHKLKCAIIGWYTYSDSNSMIQGSPHPSVLVLDSATELLAFAEREFNRKWEVGTPVSFDDIRNLYRTVAK